MVHLSHLEKILFIESGHYQSLNWENFRQVFWSRQVSTGNHMFGRVICDKLAHSIFENFEITRVKP